jgi:hypothetical protein
MVGAHGIASLTLWLAAQKPSATSARPAVTA